MNHSQTLFKRQFNFTINLCKKRQVQDSNSQLLNHEFPPITTKPTKAPAHILKRDLFWTGFVQLISCR